MALRSLTYSTGYTLKVVLRDYSTGAERLWNAAAATPAFETYNAANIAGYGISVTEGSPGTYRWTVPATLPASTAGFEYQATAYDAAATLTTTHLASPVWFDSFEWTGTTAATLAAIPTNPLLDDDERLPETTIAAAADLEPDIR